LLTKKQTNQADKRIQSTLGLYRIISYGIVSKCYPAVLWQNDFSTVYAVVADLHPKLYLLSEPYLPAELEC